MPNGLALTIGLNSVDPTHYGGWSGDLNACEADAEDMAAIAKSKKFKVKTLMTASATRAQVANEILAAAKALKSGDIFLLSYSGHGGQLPDMNSDEPDMQDETWCLFDGEQVDDELNAMLGKFAKGVRILVFSDSCHSGSVTKLAFFQGTTQVRASSINPETREVKYRNMPPDVALRTYRQNKKFYDPILGDKALKNAAKSIKASTLLFSGCQDNQLSQDGDFNGLFTANMLRVWKEGKFKGSYKDFHKQIIKNMPPDQTPNYFFIGESNAAFEGQNPFKI
ncbi:MAG: caspase family protein [Pyrinomonadaceae bacterium]|nr:caspase family protein [Pyrinomonadaceae bacterium]